VRRDERVVAYVTGHGLKTIEAVAHRARPHATIAPTMDAFNDALGAELEDSSS
jgi:threonine synthase